MNSNEKYFISLISSHLNNEMPAEAANVDWEEIYRLSCIHNVCAMAANEILKLGKESRPDNAIISKFRQQMGYTLIDFDEKNEALEFTKKRLNDNQIEYLLVKGAVLNNYYPVKEFRTSSDIDIVIKSSRINECINAFNNAGINPADTSANFFCVNYKNQHIEIHGNLDCDNPYFENIFDLCSGEGFEYNLDLEHHLLYVLCHIIKHFNFCGAGIKMFTDIDVLIRNTDNFNYDEFIKRCESINISTFAKSAFSLCKKWFNTPVKTEAEFDNNDSLITLFETEIINSGCFGFNQRNLGDFYLNKGTDANKNSLSKIKGLTALFFPDKEYLKNAYTYAKKHPILIPVAWSQRIITAVFKHNKQSKNTINTILTSDKNFENYRKLLNELNI